MRELVLVVVRRQGEQTGTREKSCPQSIADVLTGHKAQRAPLLAVSLPDTSQQPANGSNKLGDGVQTMSAAPIRIKLTLPKQVLEQEFVPCTSIARGAKGSRLYLFCKSWIARERERERGMFKQRQPPRLIRRLIPNGSGSRKNSKQSVTKSIT